MTETQVERQRIAAWLEAKAKAREDAMRGQSSFYAQYEDQGHMSTYCRALREVAAELKAVAG